MAAIVISGGGVVGLSTAMLLAQDGHEVTVLERDPAPVVDPAEAWAAWERQGVNQFRLLHFFLPRFRTILEAELPDVAKALDDAGALRFNPLALIPEEIRGPLRPDDDRFESLTARRPVVEAVVAATAEATPGVTVRRGAAVTGLVGSEPGRAVGVRTATGDIRADLVVDAGGRRSQLPAWIEGIGGGRVEEELDDSGFVYYGRHFRGELPVMFGPLLQDYGSVSILTLPADHGTWGLGVIVSNNDPVMRGLRHVDRWTNVVKSLPLAAHWLEGEPVEDAITVMAKIEDRHRSFVVGGEPVATGVIALGDAWACTNPSVGRGASIGLLHAVALRNLLRSDVAPGRDLALAWHRTTQETVEPYYRATLDFDRHRLAEIDATVEGREIPTDDGWEMVKALGHAANQDPDCLRALLDVVSMLALPADAVTPVFDKVIALGAGWRDVPAMGPTRAELVALASGTPEG